MVQKSCISSTVVVGGKTLQCPTITFKTFGFNLTTSEALMQYGGQGPPFDAVCNATKKELIT